jgi:hypothetical protein
MGNAGTRQVVITATPDQQYAERTLAQPVAPGDAQQGRSDEIQEQQPERERFDWEQVITF